MELLFGNHVRSGGRRIGYLAGAEVVAGSRRVTKIIFSDDGKLGSHAQTRSIEAVHVERGRVVIGQALPGKPAEAGTLLLSRSVTLVRGGRQAGHLAGVVVGDGGLLESAIGRQHWWTGRFRLPASTLDLSQPGEIRTGANASRAA